MVRRRPSLSDNYQKALRSAPARQFGKACARRALPAISWTTTTSTPTHAMSSWLPWSSSSLPDPKKSSPVTRKQVEHAADDFTKITHELAASVYARAAALPTPLLILSTFALGGTTALGARYVYARKFRRVANGEWVTPQMLARKRWIKGYVTRYCTFAYHPKVCMKNSTRFMKCGRCGQFPTISYPGNRLEVAIKVQKHTRWAKCV